MRRGEENNKVNNVLLRQSILQSIAYLQSKVYLQEKEVYELIRAFFKEYLGLDYEFTHEELLIELQNIFYDKKLEDQVLSFLRKVSKVEYSDDEYKPEELKEILIEFREIVELLIKKKSASKSFINKLMFWKVHEDEEVPVEREEEDEIAEVIEDLETNVSVDMKKGLFGEDKKIPQKRMEEQDKKEIEENPEPENSEEEKPKSVSNSLLSITKELNDHIEKNREYPRTEKAQTSVPKEMPKQELEVNQSMPEEENKEEPVLEQKLEVQESEKPIQETFDKEVPQQDSPVEQKQEETLPSNEISIPTPEDEGDDVINEAISSKPKEGGKPKNINQLLKQMKKDPSIDTYQKIQEMYSAMSPQEQKKYYQKVLTAYNNVNQK